MAVRCWWGEDKERKQLLTRNLRLILQTNEIFHPSFCPDAVWIRAADSNLQCAIGASGAKPRRCERATSAQDPGPVHRRAWRAGIHGLCRLRPARARIRLLSKCASR